MLHELEDGLKDKGIELNVEPSVPVYIAKKAYGSKKNARGLRDVVRREVEDALASAIVYNQDVDIKSFTVSANDKIEIKIN